MEAVRSNRLSAVQAVVAKYPRDCNDAFDTDGNTPVLLALKNGNEAIARELLAFSSSWKQHRNKMNWTPLHAATFGKLESIVKLDFFFFIVSSSLLCLKLLRQEEADAIE